MPTLWCSKHGCLCSGEQNPLNLVVPPLLNKFSFDSFLWQCEIFLEKRHVTCWRPIINFGRQSLISSRIGDSLVAISDQIKRRKTEIAKQRYVATCTNNLMFWGLAWFADVAAFTLERKHVTTAGLWSGLYRIIRLFTGPTSVLAQYQCSLVPLTCHPTCS